MLTSSTATSGDPLIQRIDYLVPHVSTAPGNAGEEVELFVRERSLSPAIAGDEPREAVVMLPGATSSSVVAFDLDFEGYSWAEALARAGYDVFLMDPTGYGLSPRPGLDDPCNVDPEQQNLLLDNPLEATCEPGRTQPVNSESEWDEIAAVVDFVRDLKDVDRVHLIGWSAGTMRIGGYASRHPDKVDTLIFFGPTGEYSSDTPNTPGQASPFATQLSTPTVASRSWNAQVQCGERQLDPAVRPAIWAALMALDPVGATWGSPPYDPVKAPLGGVSRSPELGERYGFNAEAAGRIEVPSLVIFGALDENRSESAQAMYKDLGSNDKTMVIIECASHWVNWERLHPIVHEVSIDWLEDGNVAGIDSGMINLDMTGQPME